jgi:tripartite-type tricarboxylate transporter receptor subunit TctC
MSLALLGAATTTPVLAEDGYPAAPVHVLIPNSAGGPTDIFARIMGEGMSKILGQSFVVDPRPGASGQIAARAMMQAEPDGYTLMMGNTGSTAVGPIISKNPAYDPVQDVSVISTIADVPIVLVVRTDLGVNTVQDLIDLIHKNPKGVTFGSSGVGQSTHMAAELFLALAGATKETVIIPTSGASQVANDLASGTVQAMFASSGAFPLIESGVAKAIAIGSAERSPLIPDVPTIRESGLEAFNINSWYALVARADTPPGVIDKLNAAAVQVLNSDETRKRFADMDAAPIPSTPQEGQSFLKNNIASWKDTIKRIQDASQK